MKPAIAEIDWLDHFRDSMLQAESFRACLTLGASWLCEWIDKELAVEGLDALDVGVAFHAVFFRVPDRPAIDVSRLLKESISIPSILPADQHSTKPPLRHSSTPV